MAWCLKGGRSICRKRRGWERLNRTIAKVAESCSTVTWIRRPERRLGELKLQRLAGSVSSFGVSYSSTRSFFEAVHPWTAFLVSSS
jgi:hypothetical protein